MKLCYDGNCRFCARAARWVQKKVPAIQIEPRSDLSAVELHTQGRVYSGMEAIVVALARQGGLWHLWRVYYAPGVRQAMNGAYALFAANRHKLGCAIEGSASPVPSAPPSSPCPAQRSSQRDQDRSSDRSAPSERDE